MRRAFNRGELKLGDGANLAAKPLFTPAKQLADPETLALRSLICYEPCQFNQAGVCRQCCASVPIPVLVRLSASRCGKGYW